MSEAQQIQDGDVFRYERERYHCREGIAVAQVRNGNTYLIDTFWGGGGQDSHVLTSEERATAEFEFRPSEYRELERNEPFDDYQPKDRQTIPSQHGLQVRRFLKRDAVPDRTTKIQNARDALEDAEQKLASAESWVKWRRIELNELLDGPAS